MFEVFRINRVGKMVTEASFNDATEAIDFADLASEFYTGSIYVIEKKTGRPVFIRP